MTDATLCRAVTVFAAAHFQAVHGPSTHQIDIYALKGMVISSINESLLSSTRSISDEIIGAIIKLAAFEGLFGDRNACEMHMKGLGQIVLLRGGLPSLGLHGLLERMLLWTDANASRAAGFDLFFDKSDFPTAVPHPQPDPYWMSAARHDSIAMSSTRG